MEKFNKKVKNFMIPLNEHPHMPYWGTLKEAIVQLNLAYEMGHHIILVFDEAYKLVGILTQKDILKGLDPKFAQPNKAGAPLDWNELIQTGINHRLSRPIKEFMSEVKVKLAAEDPILKASRIMIHHQSSVLPVMEKEKLIGVVRMRDLFHEITNMVLNL
jgi:CBS domain-containing protein